MKPNRPTLSTVFLSLPLAYALSALVAMPSAQATDLYWDVDGNTAGFSTVVGAWNGTNSFWNTRRFKLQEERDLLAKLAKRG